MSADAAAVEKLDTALKAAVTAADIKAAAGCLKQIYGADFNGAGSGLAKTLRKMQDKHPDAKIQNACQKILQKWDEANAAAASPSKAKSPAAAAAAATAGGVATADQLTDFDTRVKGLVRANDDGGVVALVNQLRGLRVTLDALSASGIGKTISRCAKKHGSEVVKAQCADLINHWKDATTTAASPQSAMPTPKGNDAVGDGGGGSGGGVTLAALEKLLGKLKTAGKNKDNAALLSGLAKLVRARVRACVCACAPARICPPARASHMFLQAGNEAPHIALKCGCCCSAFPLPGAVPGCRVRRACAPFPRLRTAMQRRYRYRASTNESRQYHHLYHHHYHHEQQQQQQQHTIDTDDNENHHHHHHHNYHQLPPTTTNHHHHHKIITAGIPETRTTPGRRGRGHLPAD